MKPAAPSLGEDHGGPTTAVSRLPDDLPLATPACLVQLAGPTLGRRWVLETVTIIGRDSSCQVVVDLENVSRRHAQVFRFEGGFHVCDLDSTNGTSVNREKLTSASRALHNGDYLGVGSAIFKYLGEGNIEQQYFEEIYHLTISDGLTEAYNKRYLLEALEREMSRCARYGRALSLVMMDLDHFKSINDTLGHLAGDFVLRELAQEVVRPLVRREQCFARYGGEEFALLIPEAGPENARKLAEKIRREVQDHPFRWEGRRVPVTLSLGVADLTAALTEPLGFLKAADENLYRAKKAGRNRVVG